MFWATLLLNFVLLTFKKRVEDCDYINNKNKQIQATIGSIFTSSGFAHILIVYTDAVNTTFLVG